MSPKNLAVVVGTSLVVVEIMNAAMANFYLSAGPISTIGALILVCILAVFFVSAAKWARSVVAILMILCVEAGGMAYTNSPDKLSPSAFWYLANVGYGVLILGFLLFSGKLDRHFSPY